MDTYKIFNPVIGTYTKEELSSISDIISLRDSILLEHFEKIIKNYAETITAVKIIHEGDGAERWETIQIPPFDSVQKIVNKVIDHRIISKVKNEIEL